MWGSSKMQGLSQQARSKRPCPPPGKLPKGKAASNGGTALGLHPIQLEVCPEPGRANLTCEGAKKEAAERLGHKGPSSTVSLRFQPGRRLCPRHILGREMSMGG